MLNILLLLVGAQADTVFWSVTCSGSPAVYNFNGSVASGQVWMFPSYSQFNFVFEDTSCAAHPMQIQVGGTAVVNQASPCINNNTGISTGTLTFDPSVNTLVGTYTFASTGAGDSAMAGTLNLGTPADAPYNLYATAQSATTSDLQWYGSVQDCSAYTYKVLFQSPSPTPGTPVPGCDGVSTDYCTATGLSETATYAYSVQTVCSSFGFLSSGWSQNLTFGTAATPLVTGLTITNNTGHSVVINWNPWTIPANAGCQFDWYQFVVSLPSGDTIPLNDPGCDCCNPLESSCIITELDANTLYTFGIYVYCSNDVFNGATTNTTSMTNDMANYNVTCMNTTTMGIQYFLNGTQSPNISITPGNSVTFNVDGSCSGTTDYPLIIATGTPANATLYNDGLSCNDVYYGDIVLDTSKDTPNLIYACNNNPMLTGGSIMLSAAMPQIVPAGAPSSLVVTAQTNLPNLYINWMEGTKSADCVFSSWSVMFSGGGAVPGCTGLTMESVTNCTATNLTGSTSYTFTVQQICANPMANSMMSTSTPMMTISTVGIVICQGGGTCNCGNATTCTCQDTTTCNCGTANLCVCQLGVCNGNNANEFICESAHCNQQCAKSCIGLCLGSLDSLFGGKGSCTSGSAFVSVSMFLLAGLALVAL